MRYEYIFGGRLDELANVEPEKIQDFLDIDGTFVQLTKLWFRFVGGGQTPPPPLNIPKISLPDCPGGK